MLSIWQLKRQLAFLAARVTWAEAPTGLVFSGGGFVSEQLEGMFKPGSMMVDPTTKMGTNNTTGVTPLCRVSCSRIEWDQKANNSRIERASFRLHSTAGGGGEGGPGTIGSTKFDTNGINQVTGANRAAANPQGQSQGRDVDELITRFIEFYGKSFFRNDAHGFQGRFREAAGLVPVHGVQILKRVLEFDVFDAAESNFYHPASSPTRVISGDYANLFFVPPPARFDSLSEGFPVIRGALRRGLHAGDPAPTTSSGGVAAPSASSPLANEFTVNQGVGAGTYNYAYFAPYAETPAGQLAGVADRYASTPVTWSATT